MKSIRRIVQVIVYYPIAWFKSEFRTFKGCPKCHSKKFFGVLLCGWMKCDHCGNAGYWNEPNTWHKTEIWDPNV